MNNGGNSFGNVESDLVSSCKCYLEKKGVDTGQDAYSILNFVCAIQLLFCVTVFRQHSQNVVG